MGSKLWNILPFAVLVIGGIEYWFLPNIYPFNIVFALIIVVIAAAMIKKGFFSAPKFEEEEFGTAKPLEEEAEEEVLQPESFEKEEVSMEDFLLASPRDRVKERAKQKEKKAEEKPAEKKKAKEEIEEEELIEGIEIEAQPKTVPLKKEEVEEIAVKSFAKKAPEKQTKAAEEKAKAKQMEEEKKKKPKEKELEEMKQKAFKELKAIITDEEE